MGQPYLSCAQIIVKAEW